MPGPPFVFLAFVVLVTLVAAVHFAFRPTERRLSVIRPLCAATICSGLAAFLLGVANGLMALQMLMRRMGVEAAAPKWPEVLGGVVESFAPLVLAFGGVAVAWLCVAVGLRRQV